MVILLWLVSLLLLTIAFLWGRDIKNKGFYQRLFELEETLEGQMDFTNLSKSILARIIHDISAAAGVIYWLDEAQQEYKLKTINGIPADKIGLITRALRQPGGLLEKMRSASQACIMNDLKTGIKPRGAAETEDLTPIFRSLIAVPLVTGEKQTMGVLVLFKTKGGFGRGQLNLLSVFSPRMTIRLDNARLYQLTQETALENARLYVNISKLYQQAIIDELTGLYNRNFLMQRIKEEINKSIRLKQPLSLIFMDLDFFKGVNDKYGHQSGDELLKEMGQLLKKSTREYDVASRFGGEEFVIMLPHTQLENAADLAERLRIRIAAEQFNAGLRITASFGVSSIPGPVEYPPQLGEESINIYIENLVARADDALYQAKNTGRNKVVVSQNQQNT